MVGFHLVLSHRTSIVSCTAEQDFKKECVACGWGNAGGLRFSIGRLRVVRIDCKEVIFGIEI